MEEFEIERKEYNDPVKIARDEYSSIMQAFYEHVLRGVVQHGRTIDRNALDMTISELEWKVENPNFQKLSYPVQQAYQKFRELSLTLKEVSDADISNFHDALYTVFLQGISCNTYGDSISGGRDSIYYGRNPCREIHFQMNSALKQAEEKLGNAKLLNALKGMFEVCKKCPYKES